MFEGSLSSVLIVENENGEVFFVENKSNSSKLPREEKKIEPKPSKRKQEIKIKEEIESDDDYDYEDHLPLAIKQEIKDEPPDQYEDVDFTPAIPFNYEAAPVFIDPDLNADGVVIKKEPKVEKSDSEEYYDASAPEKTFDGHWTSDSDDDSFEFNVSDAPKPETIVTENGEVKKKRIKRKMHKITDLRSKITLAKHKFRNLRGRLACRYCDKVFIDRDEKKAHKCPYLDCDPKNFICRFCDKELSKKTFSNHVHEALNCQYCGRKILNPRNMKLHIQKKHKGEKYVPPKEKNRKKQIEEYVKQKIEEEAEIMMRLKENPKKEIRKYYPKKKTNMRLQCDLCGKTLASLSSMRQHMGIHLDTPIDICAVCGEKFFTRKGMQYHSCNRKQRRPEKDYRINDLRECRYCGVKFDNLDENKAHLCPYKHPTDKKLVICRFCDKEVPKASFSRHLEVHSGIDYTCRVCNKKVASKRALRIHMTIHTGDKPHKCSYCSEGFCNKTALDYHMRFHGQTTKVYRCEFCFKELSTEYSLKSHIKRVHRKTSQCEICKQEFTSKEMMKDHVRMMHEPSVCKVCGKSFILPRYMRMHEKLHYDNGPEAERHPCSICSKYLTEKNLKSHVFRKHPEQFEEWQNTYVSYQ
ncbi:hypothetical protein PVAND_016408 [Polypedilum vanderplanki]|uniref:C2H2-type domain-containing protein n=1 Tax=Polypedilum vanderplanki TaxID=319348 RepID=A0A9J6BF25_POLVA|nr:hypothetical protein PVAND_016408 [Polypedilum vanderplanki]